MGMLFMKPNSYSRLIRSPPIQHALLIASRRKGYILNFGQAPDGESNDLNHSESEFVSQTVNETEVGVRKPNGSGLEFFIRHRCYCYNTTNRRVVAEEHQMNAKRQLNAIFEVLCREEFSRACT
jgi:hypothetical protein